MFYAKPCKREENGILLRLRLIHGIFHGLYTRCHCAKMKLR